ncbi:hypothetical protein J5N97_002919 [Dioscorea zingiberensis]|uniref:Uncharacterized protein n=1 Tax=Dioscorea zingiberensis TaxID=325984 RepID=A0A9D5D5Q2_9LILI|nr:hypothetical protein J5N97_002919 [Dioscorea zingiberensis]
MKGLEEEEKGLEILCEDLLRSLRELGMDENEGIEGMNVRDGDLEEKEEKMGKGGGDDGDGRGIGSSFWSWNGFWFCCKLISSKTRL